MATQTPISGFARWWEEQVTACLREIQLNGRDLKTRLRVQGRLERLLMMHVQFTDKREDT